ncbi:MAG: hypothetical protein ACI9TO_001341 [Rickettsiales bacterium]|jgi:hypothetical protein
MPTILIVILTNIAVIICVAALNYSSYGKPANKKPDPKK